MGTKRRLKTAGEKFRDFLGCVAMGVVAYTAGLTLLSFGLPLFVTIAALFTDQRWLGVVFYGALAVGGAFNGAAIYWIESADPDTYPEYHWTDRC